MTVQGWIWCGAAALSLLWGAMVLAAGGSPMVSGLVVGLTTVCAASPDARARVERWIAVLFSGPAWRSALIIGGALMLIQLLPVELALLAAGDVLAYVEVVAAVSLISANTRLRPLLASIKARMQTPVGTLRPSPASARAARTSRPAVRRKAPPADTDGAGRAFA
jgi:hypothetical protein